MSKRIALRIVAVAIAIVLVGWGAVKHEREGTPPGPGPLIAADAKAFTLGSLRFTACELAQKRSGATTRAYCAAF